MLEFRGNTQSWSVVNFLMQRIEELDSSLSFVNFDDTIWIPDRLTEKLPRNPLLCL